MAAPERTDSHCEVIWDVVAEHLDEAAFGVEQFERALDHPSRTLAELDRYPEGRLLAHLDGLVVAGDGVWTQLLEPQLTAADPAAPEHITAAALALLLAEQTNAIWDALAHDAPEVRAATLRAVTLCPGSIVDRAVILRLQAANAATTRATLLDLLAQRQLSPPPLFEHLQSPDSAVVAAAARACVHADAASHTAIVEDLMSHHDYAVRQAALITALTWGSRRAWSACLTLATEPSSAQSTAMVLLALLGGRQQHARLVELLEDKTCRRHALYALGYSGNLELLPQLVQQLSGPDAKLAGQAIATILGIELPALEPASVANAEPHLPPLEADLEQTLIPPPEDALPLPDPEAVAVLVAARLKQSSPRQRYVHGQVLTRDTLLDALEHAPLRRRHDLALALAIRSGGTSWLNTRAFSRVQHRQLSRLRRQSEAHWSSGPESL